MSDTYVPGLMELDSFWENAVRVAVEDTIYDQKRLEFALENRSKINKRLESLGYKTVPRQKKFIKNVSEEEGKEEEEEEDKDEMFEASSLDESESADSMDGDLNSDTEAKRNIKKGHESRGKVKKPITEEFSSKKSHLKSVQEPMDTRYDEDKTNSLKISRLKQSPCDHKKKKLALMITELKRKKNKLEKGSKRGKMRSKSCRSKHTKKRLNENKKCDESKVHKNEIEDKKTNEVKKEEKITPAATTNKDDTKKEGNREGKTEMAGDKKKDQNVENAVKNQAKPMKEVEPKEGDFMYCSMGEFEQSSCAASTFGEDDFS